MADFSLTEEQKAFRDTLKRFAEKELKPIAIETDRISDLKENWSVVGEVVKKGLQLGFGKILLPKEYGGLEWGLLELEILGEELGVADAGIALDIVGTASIPLLLAFAGMEDQKEK